MSAFYITLSSAIELHLVLVMVMTMTTYVQNYDPPNLTKTPDVTDEDHGPHSNANRDDHVPVPEVENRTTTNMTTVEDTMSALLQDIAGTTDPCRPLEKVEGDDLKREIAGDRILRMERQGMREKEGIQEDHHYKTGRKRSLGQREMEGEGELYRRKEAFRLLVRGREVVGIKILPSGLKDTH